MIKVLRKIYIIPLKKHFNTKKFNELLQFVSIEKAEQVKRFYNNMDKKLSLYAQVAVKLIIQKECNIDIKKMSIVPDEWGKPYILELPDIHFNISHTHNTIVIGFSENPVGVDIESQHDKSLEIAKRFFTQREYDYISCENKNQDIAFLEIWTKKEAYIKCSGIGLRKSLKDFCVMDDSLKDKFITLKRDDFVISFYDGICNKELPLIELSEKEIEKSQLNY